MVTVSISQEPCSIRNKEYNWSLEQSFNIAFKICFSDGSTRTRLDFAYSAFQGLPSRLHTFSSLTVLWKYHALLFWSMWKLIEMNLCTTESSTPQERRSPQACFKLVYTMLEISQAMNIWWVARCRWSRHFTRTKYTNLHTDEISDALGLKEVPLSMLMHKLAYSGGSFFSFTSPGFSYFRNQISGQEYEAGKLKQGKDHWTST